MSGSNVIRWNGKKITDLSHIQQDRQCIYNVNTEQWQHNHCCHGKAIRITYSECVSVFLPYLSGVQSAMHCSLLSSAACLILTNISISPHKWHNSFIH